MTRSLLLLVCVSVLSAGCTPKHVATPEEVRANHDRAWTIESLPASAPTPTEAVGTSGTSEASDLSGG